MTSGPDGDRLLSAESALHLTTAIKIAADALFVLLAQARAGKAHLALGYPDWQSYVRVELGISKSRSYQLLDQHRVNEEIEAAAGVPLPEPISEAVARNIKPRLEHVTALIRNHTQGLDDTSAVLRVVATALDAARHPDASPENPMPSMASLRDGGGQRAGGDLWYTPRQAVVPLLPSLPPPPRRIWCPADVDGQSHIVDVLRERGYEVVCSDISTGQDFLAYTRDSMPPGVDLVITNPPYSQKKSWVEHLHTLRVEQWALLLPEIGLGDWGHDLLSRLGGDVGLVMLNRRIAYSQVFGRRPVGNPPFSSTWVVAGLTRPGEQIVFRDVPRLA